MDDKKNSQRGAARGQMEGREAPRLPFMLHAPPHGTHACRLRGRLLPRAEAGI